jgi:hypothetical protein
MSDVPKYLSDQGGVGLSNELSDNAFWLNLDFPTGWIDLLDKLDRTKDPRLLLPYLNVPEVVRPHLADLFDRHTLKSRTRRTPSYQRTPAQLRLGLAVDHVKNRKRGESQKAAIDDAVREWGVSHSALTKALKGRHAAFRRSRSPSR